MPYLSEGTVAYGETREWIDHDPDNYDPVDQLWEVADRFAQVDIVIVNVDYVIEILDGKKDLDEAEKAMLKMCKEAEAMGASDLSLY